MEKQNFIQQTAYLLCNVPLFELDNSISSSISNEALMQAAEQYYGYLRSELLPIHPFVVNELKKLDPVDNDPIRHNTTIISHIPYLVGHYTLNNQKLEAVKVLKYSFDLDLKTTKDIVDRVWADYLKYSL